MRFGYGELDTFVGDIWEIATQAFLCPITTDMRPVAGLGADIARRAGPEIPRLLAEMTPVRLGSAVRTDAGSLRCKHLIHVAICTLAKPPEIYVFKDALQEALRICQSGSIRSVAIPPMGFIEGKLAVRPIASVFVRECLQCLKVSKMPERMVCVVPSDYVDGVFREVIEEQVEELT